MKNQLIVNDEFRIKIVNFLRIYGYYKGILISLEFEKRYISGNLLLEDIIKNKKDFKVLKLSINKVLDYCYENNFKEIENIMNFFYKYECRDIRKKFGNLFDKF